MGKTLWEFLTKYCCVEELCVIREGGWIKATVWIDYEDNFQLPDGYSQRKVKSESRGTLPIKNADFDSSEFGNRIEIPVRYIDI